MLNDVVDLKDVGEMCISNLCMRGRHRRSAPCSPRQLRCRQEARAGAVAQAHHATEGVAKSLRTAKAAAVAAFVVWSWGRPAVVLGNPRLLWPLEHAFRCPTPRPSPLSHPSCRTHNDVSHQQLSAHAPSVWQYIHLIC